MVDDFIIVAEGPSLKLLVTVIWLLRASLYVELYDAVMDALLVLVSEIDSCG